MRLEEVGLRDLVPQTTAHARERQQRLQLLGIYRETNQIEIKELQDLIETQEEYQRGYFLENPHEAGRIQLNTQARKKRAANKQLKDDNLPGPPLRIQPASRQVPPS